MIQGEARADSDLQDRLEQSSAAEETHVLSVDYAKNLWASKVLRFYCEECRTALEGEEAYLDHIQAFRSHHIGPLSEKSKVDTLFLQVSIGGRTRRFYLAGAVEENKK